MSYMRDSKLISQFIDSVKKTGTTIEEINASEELCDFFT
jgi:hypothetical protein